ncbi:hypothetical protein BH11PSE9_BH11PSE9_19280 [soil metagenome]
MKNAMKNEKPENKSAARAPNLPGKTVPREANADKTAVDLTDETHSGEAALPHERDQSVGMTGGVPSKTVQQAHRDVKRGLQDTSRAPEADKAYDKLKK